VNTSIFSLTTEPKLL